MLDGCHLAPGWQRKLKVSLPARRVGALSETFHSGVVQHLLNAQANPEGGLVLRGPDRLDRFQDIVRIHVPDGLCSEDRVRVGLHAATPVGGLLLGLQAMLVIFDEGFGYGLECGWRTAGLAVPSYAQKSGLGPLAAARGIGAPRCAPAPARADPARCPGRQVRVASRAPYPAACSGTPMIERRDPALEDTARPRRHSAPAS